MEKCINIIDFVTIAALFITIYQSILTKKALLETRKSIEQDKINRQLSLLPKVGWIIQVRVELELWQKELEERSVKLKEALLKNDENILKELSGARIKKPSDLGLSKYQYDKMPEWLSEIWLSGAQYYYDAMASMFYLYEDGKGKFVLAEGLSNRCVKNGTSIKKLLEYISDMIPEVILETPASTNNSEFFRE